MKKTLTVLGVLVLVVILVVGVGTWLSDRGGEVGTTTGAPSSGQVDQPASCPAYEVIAAPGTWESSADDDPVHPTANPDSLLLNVTNPLQEAYGGDATADGANGGVKVWTLPYPAQFRNINALDEMSYDDSRTEGYNRVSAEMTATYEACPGTKFLLVGFSQGAVLTGDLVTGIGNGDGPVPAENIAGVSLIADGRREDGKGTLVGSADVQGIGAEIALSSVSVLVQPIVPGATMRGPRPQDFGALQDRVNQFCDPADLVCSAPRDVGNALQRANDLIAANGIHAQYSSNGNVVPGETVPQWIVNWARDIIDNGK
ncbi:cutinase family protein [Corynebacterium terpenotabidum]|uniref:Envelope lipids regulation factor n=1 Tax=Corynebacterium terpenotabidum Y-11 TaxID=1200352 RepID=S4XGS7_9CORY|nr:cutinase family protein [Corynebacterium terpenotabidum]AGP29858.1 envelope lipids regulation factor [Corynebacterium terpenotabidum Y-11]